MCKDTRTSNMRHKGTKVCTCHFCCALQILINYYGPSFFGLCVKPCLLHVQVGSDLAEGFSHAKTGRFPALEVSEDLTQEPHVPPAQQFQAP